MSGMIDRLAKLAPRERGLLGVLVGVMVPVALWFGVLEPLAARRSVAQDALVEARALNGWVTQRAREMDALGAVENSGPRSPIGLSAVEQTLISADLREAVSGLANRSEGGIELRFEAVEFTRLMAWLSGQEPGWGYDIAALRLSRGEEAGVVSAEVRLVPQG